MPRTGTASPGPRIRPSGCCSSPKARSPSTSTLRDPDAAEWPSDPIPSATKPSLLSSDHATRRRGRAAVYSQARSGTRQDAASTTSLPHLGRSAAAPLNTVGPSTPLSPKAHLWLLLSILPHAHLGARLLMCVCFFAAEAAFY